MSNWIKRITGIEAIEEKLQESIAAEQRLRERGESLRAEQDKLQVEIDTAKEAKEAAEKAESNAKLSPKERANELGEPWVNVLDVKVNHDNVRNGFFELDWNRLFIDSLVTQGYGTEADPEEEVVDRWFRDIVFQMLNEEGVDPATTSGGYINVTPINNNRSEVS